MSDVIKIQSGVNGDLEPFVLVTWGKEAGQWSPDEARLHALSVRAAADAAEADACLVRFVVDEIEAPHAEIQPMLLAFRGFREEWRRSNPVALAAAAARLAREAAKPEGAQP